MAAKRPSSPRPTSRPRRAAQAQVAPSSAPAGRRPAAAAAASASATTPAGATAPGPPPEIAAELAHAAADPSQRAAVWKSPAAVSSVLQEIATLLLLTNANTFKVRAYENAARTLAGLGEDLDAVLE